MRITAFALLVAAMVLQSTQASAVATPDGAVPGAMREGLGPFLGDYRGNWNTEMTESEVDDISRYDLSDSVLRLSMDAEHRLRVEFFIDPGAAQQNLPLDLLGYGCQTRIGPLRDMDRQKAEDGTVVIRASFDFDWGRCPSRVHSVAGTRLNLELAASQAEAQLAARLTLLRKVQGDYQVYAKINGERQPVRVRPKENGDGSLYHPELEYCVEDELGEESCYSQRSEVKVIGAPAPFPGATVLWWTKKTPSLTVEKGKKLLYHEALYTRPM